MPTVHVTNAIRAKDQLDALAAMLAKDDTLTPEGKRQEVEKAWEAAKRELAQHEAKHRAEVEARMSTLRSLLYSPPQNSPQFGTYRQALDRAERAADDPHKMAELMRQAKDSGDLAQQHAVFVVAEKAGDADPQHLEVAKFWLDQNPNLIPKYTELAELENPDMSPVGLQEAAAFTLPTQPKF